MLMVAWIVFSLVLYISCDDEEGCPPGTETIRDSNGDIVDCFSLIEDTWLKEIPYAHASLWLVEARVSFYAEKEYGSD